MVERIDWSPDELRESTATRSVYRTDEASHHLLRTTVNEKPHVHDKSDLTVTVLSGSTRIHFQRHFFDLKPGDVVRVPRGVPHWMELVGEGGAEAYVVFSPPFDGKDRRFVDDMRP